MDDGIFAEDSVFQGDDVSNRDANLTNETMIVQSIGIIGTTLVSVRPASVGTVEITAYFDSGVHMKPLSTLGYMQLTIFAKPVCDRAIYKTIKKNKYRSFVEIGMGDGTRSQNLIRVAKKFGVSSNVRYTGVDQFDARPEGQNALPLIQMHKKLKALDAKTQLVPGDMPSAVARIANSHVRTDLIVISAGVKTDQLNAIWFYLPRMLHSGSVLMIQKKDGDGFEILSRLEIEKLAEKYTPQRSMAA